jgi:hypothetical protein
LHWSFTALTDTVATWSITVLRTVSDVLIQSADGITTDAAIHRTVVRILALLADVVATRGHAVNRTYRRIFPRSTVVVATRKWAVYKTVIRIFIQPADSIPTPAAIHLAIFGAFAAFTFAISTSYQTVLGT